jgi:hypothetical protein
MCKTFFYFHLSSYDLRAFCKNLTVAFYEVVKEDEDVGKVTNFGDISDYVNLL